MKKWKQYAAILLALVMCLGLAACGGDDEDTIPDTIKNLALNASVEYDYSHFMGTWMGEDDIVLVMEHFDEYYNSERFELHDADNKLLASGSLQYVEEYGFVYAYNEQDCIAHICWINDDGSLYIDSFGSFTKVSGDVPGGAIGDVTVEPPMIIESLAIDDSVVYDYSAFLGTWLGAENTKLTAEDYGDGRIYYTLSDADDDYVAGGNLQYVEEYDCVYAYNDYDGFAYQCAFNEDGTLYIASFFGTFTKVSGDAPGDVVGDADDFTVLVGTWNLYGDEDATTVIDFTDGGWTLWELDSDGSWCLTDGGSLRAMGDGAYEALSEYYDVTYDMYLLEDNEMMWDGTYFAKSE